MNRLAITQVSLALYLLAPISGLQAQFKTEPQALAFSYPGGMITIPSASHLVGPDFLQFGFGMDLKSFSGFKAVQGIYADFEPSARYRIGVTAVKGFADEDTPEFGLHIQRTIFTFETMAIAAGVSDIVFVESTDTLSVGGTGEQFLTSRVGAFSFYGVVSREQGFDGNSLRWYVGIGTDRFGPAPAEKTTTQPGVFIGVDFTSDYLKWIGGLRILGEYDGRGINLGTKVPITRDYTVNFALTHVHKIFKFGQKEELDNLTTRVRAPGIGVGLSLNFPRRLPEPIIDRPTGFPPVPVTELPTGEAPLFPPGVAEEYVPPEQVQAIRDSLAMSGKQIETLTDLVAFLSQRIQVLQDSVQTAKAGRFALEQNINQALKHLSRSLNYFYTSDYRGALNEVDTAIEFNPNLSLAYARRGSIYYKLGNMERAVMNWNVALQLDPEYEDVRNILRAMGENRLRTASLTN